jgi:hypothetical protein
MRPTIRPGYPFRVAHDAPVVAGTVIDLIKPEADARWWLRAPRNTRSTRRTADPRATAVAARVAWRPYRRGPTLKVTHPHRTFPNNGGMPDRRRVGPLRSPPTLPTLLDPPRRSFLFRIFKR